MKFTDVVFLVVLVFVSLGIVVPVILLIVSSVDELRNKRKKILIKEVETKNILVPKLQKAVKKYRHTLNIRNRNESKYSWLLISDNCNRRPFYYFPGFMKWYWRRGGSARYQIMSSSGSTLLIRRNITNIEYVITEEKNG